jgi:hypothetical protein
MCLFSGGPVPPGFSLQLDRTRRLANGVPTSTADYAHWRLSALPELAVDAITNFLSEFGQLEHG